MIRRLKKFDFKRIEDTSWVHFYPRFDYTCFKVSPYSYFDPRVSVCTDVSFLFALLLAPFLGSHAVFLLPLLFFSWGRIYINLPFVSLDAKGNLINSAEGPTYGFSFTDAEGGKMFILDHLQISLGDKSKYIEFPWAVKWYRTSYLSTQETWLNEIANHRLDLGPWQDDWENKVKCWKHPYTYTLESGEIQECIATFWVEEREWRRKWLMFTSLFSRVKRELRVKFSKEMGEKVGSWKGGTVGCSWPVTYYQTPTEALLDMQKNRKL